VTSKLVIYFLFIFGPAGGGALLMRHFVDEWHRVPATVNHLGNTPLGSTPDASYNTMSTIHYMEYGQKHQLKMAVPWWWGRNGTAIHVWTCGFRVSGSTKEGLYWWVIMFAIGGAVLALLACLLFDSLRSRVYSYDTRRNLQQQRDEMDRRQAERDMANATRIAPSSCTELAALCRIHGTERITRLDVSEWGFRDYQVRVFIAAYFPGRDYAELAELVRFIEFSNGAWEFVTLAVIRKLQALEIVRSDFFGTGELIQPTVPFAHEVELNCWA
jgi:hypothetical protein